MIWKWSLFALNCVGCGVVLFFTVPVIEKNVFQSLFQLYSPFVPLLLMLWLWGVNVWWFERNYVPYQECFEKNLQKYLVSHAAILEIAGTITANFLVNLTMCAYFCALQMYDTAGYCPYSLYFFTSILLLLPINYMYRDVRLFFSVTLLRIILPFQPVNFADFLLADVLTSLSKPIADVGQNICYMIHRNALLQPNLDGSDEARCGSQREYITIILLYPFFARLIQCIWDYFVLSKKAQLLNALKYSTMIPVAYFFMLRNQLTSENQVFYWFLFWLTAQIINTSYCYFWDVERDWDISWFSSLFASGSYAPKIKPQKLFQGEWFYYYCLVSNLILRFGWSYKLSLELSSFRNLVLVMSLLEVFRRFQWIFIRIETEMRKISTKEGKDLFDYQQLSEQENGILHVKRVKSHNVMESPLF
eukprot:TRINITY_DN5588_c1_g1_i1.p1 TRINITY_DN5588_c1_g1~~TRINITY_DN5588_c1_g1_i1.p1  ORF type:complete len:418 (-),score=29.83 TRINITY_DN5588_c1_g1_i1:162-1415(-)